MSSGWDEVALGEVCELRYGKALKAEQRSGSGWPVYGSNGPVGAHDVALTDGPTIVVGRKGSYGEVHYSDGPAWPIDTTYFVDATSTSCDLRWLAYRLDGLRLNELNRAAAVPGLNREDAYRRRLLLPPLEEQRRIGKILDAATALRAKRRRSLNELEALQEAQFVQAFGNAGSNDRGWPMAPLGTLATKFSDGPFGSNLKSADYVESGVRVVRLQNIGTGEFKDADAAYVSEEHFATIAKHECLPGDVLIATLGDPNLRACVLPHSVGRAINKADCVQMRVDLERAAPEYVVGLLNQRALLRRATALSTGQTRTRISMGRLRDMPVPVPPLAIQEAFARRARRLDTARAVVRSHLAELDALFASLRHVAFAGEL